VTDRRKDRRTDTRTELPWLIQRSALQAMRPRCKNDSHSLQGRLYTERLCVIANLQARVAVGLFVCTCVALKTQLSRQVLNNTSIILCYDVARTA